MITLKYVDKRFPTSNALLYIHNLTFHAGEVVGVLGENGSGKTTLLKAIMGLGELTNGEILIDGKPAVEQYDRMAFVTEEGSFPPGLTPLQYAEFLAAFFPRFDIDFYMKMLQLYELPPNRKIRTFSKGQKMKLEVSAGLAKRADILLMDEPFTGSDLFSRRTSIKQLLAHLEGDETVLITTHLVDEIENVIDRVIVLHQGLIKADVYVDDLREAGTSLEEIMVEARKSPYWRS